MVLPPRHYPALRPELKRGLIFRGLWSIDKKYCLDGWVGELVRSTSGSPENKAGASGRPDQVVEREKNSHESHVWATNCYRRRPIRSATAYAAGRSLWQMSNFESMSGLQSTKNRFLYIQVIRSIEMPNWRKGIKLNRYCDGNLEEAILKPSLMRIRKESRNQRLARHDLCAAACQDQLTAIEQYYRHTIRTLYISALFDNWHSANGKRMRLQISILFLRLHHPI